MTVDDPALIAAQRDLCAKNGSAFVPPDGDAKVGIALASLGKHPICGLRSHPVGDTSGWYIWAGEYSPANDFFESLCVKHLPERCPEALKYLGLAAGFGFLSDSRGYEDVWFDAARLEREACDP